MNDVVIHAENLGKKFQIGHHTARQENFREAMMRGPRNLLRGAVDMLQGRSVIAGDTIEEFWALRDVNFEIRSGEAVGIIGRNGAGKTTLLKILSRITEPTEGRVKIKGRVASLLEVGTGFHPELSGRENIFLNGAILGMTRVEVRRRFDEIVDFSGVEKFIDTPVKRYSTGMYMRLAFAVAANLEPDILIVDEVLAVGDAEFQKKCIGKIGDVAAKQGRTVLFVSHNMATVSKLCGSAIVLEKGRMVFAGPKDAAINFYTRANFGAAETTPLAERKDRKGNGQMRIMELSFLNASVNQNIQSVDCSAPLSVRIRYVTRGNAFAGRFAIGIYDAMDICPIFLDTLVAPNLPSRIPAEGEIIVTLSPDFFLAPGDYNINVAGMINGDMADWVVSATVLRVHDGDFFGSGKSPGAKQLCLVKQKWSLNATAVKGPEWTSP